MELLLERLGSGSISEAGQLESFVTDTLSESESAIRAVLTRCSKLKKLVLGLGDGLEGGPLPPNALPSLKHLQITLHHHIPFFSNISTPIDVLDVKFFLAKPESLDETIALVQSCATNFDKLVEWRASIGWGKWKIGYERDLLILCFAGFRYRGSSTEPKQEFETGTGHGDYQA